MTGQDQTSTLREILVKDLISVMWLRVIVDMYGEKQNDTFFPDELQKKIMDKEPDIVMIDNCGWVYGVNVELLQRGDEYETRDTDSED